MSSLKNIKFVQNNPKIDFKKESNHFIISDFMLLDEPMSWQTLVNEIEWSETNYINGDYLISTEFTNQINYLFK